MLLPSKRSVLTQIEAVPYTQEQPQFICYYPRHLRKSHTPLNSMMWLHATLLLLLHVAKHLHKPLRGTLRTTRNLIDEA